MTKDYYGRFVDLCKLTCVTGEEYLDKQLLKRHNKAMTQLEKIMREMYSEANRCEDIALDLLANEDIKVEIVAAAYCLKASIHTKIARDCLLKIAKTTSDGMTRVRAYSNLEYCRPYNE